MDGRADDNEGSKENSLVNALFSLVFIARKKTEIHTMKRTKASGQVAK